nr:MAG TPA: hypothetical protein [Caudoviricetes sp.]
MIKYPQYSDRRKNSWLRLLPVYTMGSFFTS